MRGLSLVVASGGHSSSRCAGLSLSQPLLLRSTGSRCAGSVIVAHGPSRSTACGILPDQGSNPCALHWQADSQPLRHQGSPRYSYRTTSFNLDFSDGFLVVRQRLWVWGRKTRGKVPLSSPHIKGAYYQCDLSLLMLIFITWLRECLSGFSTVKLLIF